MMSRQNGYPYFRVLSIFAMVLLHVMVWIDSPGDDELTRAIIPYGTVEWVVGHFSFIPLGLVVITGILFERFVDFYSNQSFLIKLQGISIKALIFFSAGCLLNVITWGAEYWLEWDVLHFIAISLILALIIHRLGGDLLLAVVGLICFMKYHVNIGQPFLQSIIFGDDVEGALYYPLLPWFSWFILGYFLSKLSLSRLQWAGIFIAGTVLLSFFLDISAFPVSRANIWGPELFDPNRIILLVNTIKFLTLYSLLCLLPNIGFITVLSKGIFYFYFLHIFIGYRLTLYFYDLGWVWLLWQIPVVIAIFLLIRMVEELRYRYVIRRYLGENIGQKIDNKTRIIEEGYLDSLDIINLLAFVSKTFKVEIELDEIDPDKLESVDKIAQFVRTKDIDER